MILLGVHDESVCRIEQIQIGLGLVDPRVCLEMVQSEIKVNCLNCIKIVALTPPLNQIFKASLTPFGL